MTKPLRKTIEIIAKVLPKAKNILEIGSRQEKNQQNLANLRGLFSKANYLGVDMRKGPGVDRVTNAEKLPFKNEQFDLVICLETLEHAKRPWLVAGEIERVLAKSGTALVSSQQNFPLHLHPSDFFRYTPYGLASLFGQFKDTLVFSISPPFDQEVKLNPQAVIVVGWKTKQTELKIMLKKMLQKNIVQISGHKPYRHRLQDALKFIHRGLMETQFRHDIAFFEI